MSKPRWDRLYARHFPLDTCPCSRHCRIIASDMLRSPRSPVRKWLEDAGYEPDHMAESIEATVKALWKARARIRKHVPSNPKEPLP